ncbi:MAG: DJ-1/PfpI family protein [Ignavibacteria bacterium]
MKYYNTAIFIFENVEVLDFTGPFEIFNSANRILEDESFKVFTVAESEKKLNARNGLQVTPDFTIQNCPKPDILIIPGGEGRKIQMNNNVILQWIRSGFAELQYLFSICTGAFILGNTGLLNGQKATTHHLSYGEFEKTFPQVSLIKNVPYVDNRKIITSAGISTGMKASLYLLDIISGEDLGKRTAEYMEYDY